MNKFALAVIGSALVASSSFAQGTITFNNRVTGIVDFKIFNVDGGAALAGTGYSAQLYVGTSAESLAPVAGTVTTFRTGNAAGYFTSLGDIAVPGFAAGSTVFIQVRAWENLGGTVSSYETATTFHGKSAAVGNVVLGGAGSPPSTAASLAGLTAFNLVPVPEPTTMALAGIGGLALLGLRRKTA